MCGRICLEKWMGLREEREGMGRIGMGGEAEDKGRDGKEGK